MIVSPEPARGILLNIFDFRQEIVTQPIVSYRSIISFNVSILLRVARLDEQLSREGVLGQCCLHKCRQTIKTFAYISDAGKQPDRRIGMQADH
jgi:hypothetical protein